MHYNPQKNNNNKQHNHNRNVNENENVNENVNVVDNNENSQSQSYNSYGLEHLCALTNDCSEHLEQFTGVYFNLSVFE